MQLSLKQKIIITLSSLCLLLSISPVQAGSNNTAMQVNTKLSTTCNMSISSASLGNLSQTGATQQTIISTANIQAQCTKNTAYSIIIDLGANTDGDGRYMIGANTGALIQYGICASSTVSTNPWSCVVGNTSWTPKTAQNYTGTGSIQSIKAYVFSHTDYYVPDTYSDTATATMSF